MSRHSSRIAAGLAVAGLATTGVIALGANAFADPSASPTTTQTQAADQGTNQGGTTAPDQGDRQKCGPGGSQDTPVTGDEAQKVKDAVAGQHSDATITEVRKDPDGSYDALGTKADGSRVFYEVSADLATITENAGGGQGGPGQGHGGPGRHGGGQDAAGQDGGPQQGQAGGDANGGTGSGKSGSQNAGAQGAGAQDGAQAQPSAGATTGGR